MPYIPRISFKTGINPSMVRNFPVDGNYTGTQKLMLTATRIFGTKIGYLAYDLVVLCVQACLLSEGSDLVEVWWTSGVWIQMRLTVSGQQLCRRSRWSLSVSKWSNGGTRYCIFNSEGKEAGSSQKEMICPTHRLTKYHWIMSNFCIRLFIYWKLIFDCARNFLRPSDT